MATALRYVRLQHEPPLSQAELARRSGIPQQTIARIEAGLSRNPSHRVVMAISRALGVDPEQISEFGNGGRL